MQILNIPPLISQNIFFSPNKQDKKNFDIQTSNLAPLKQDTVSFKGKVYTEKIKNATGHCAYCGEKIYSEEQLDSIAGELIKLKGTRLAGKIRGVLEKLDMPDTYTELSIQKRKVNKEHIAFFKKLLSYSQNAGNETGGNLLLKYSDLKNEKEVKAEIMSHLKPLQKTIDHITPQRKNAENSDEDINLVEACYACNHDLKRGMDFSEFHSMYPSIETHMPEHKYQYAMANVLENSSNQVKAEISSQNLLELIDTLSAQRSHAVSTLDSINLRFKKCFEAVRTSLEGAKQEKIGKKKEIAELEKTKEEYYKNEEYRVRQEQSILSNSIKELTEKKLGLTSTIKRMGEKLSGLDNQEETKGKKRRQFSQKELELKKEEIKAGIEKAETDLHNVEGELGQKESRFSELAKKYTPLSVLLSQKTQTADIISAYDKYEANKAEIESKQKGLEKAEKALKDIEYTLSLPEPPEVKEADCTEEQKEQFGKYKALVELSNKIKNQKALNELNQQIYAHAQSDIDHQISEMSISNPLIAHAEYKRQRYLANSKLPSAKTNFNNAQGQLEQIEREQEVLKEKMAVSSREDAEAKIKELEKEIARVQAIYEDLKIVDKINSARAELKLIETTIENLENALKKEQELTTH